MLFPRILVALFASSLIAGADLQGSIAGANGPTIVYLAGRRLPPARAESIAVVHRGGRFFPDVAVAPAGSTVTFHNADPIFHNFFSVTPGDQFETGFLGRGSRYSFTLPVSGIVPIFCRLHAQDSAVIAASPSAFAAQVAPEAAAFSFKNVPPGVHELVAWTRSLGTMRMQVAIPESGVLRVDVCWDRTRPVQGGL